MVLIKTLFVGTSPPVRGKQIMKTFISSIVVTASIIIMTTLIFLPAYQA
ncbi:MAG: hypothetical protein ACJAT2_000396 [Bacteriovoracaceae bacterium]|jgi:hypothetical protein